MKIEKGRIFKRTWENDEGHSFAVSYAVVASTDKTVTIVRVGKSEKMVRKLYPSTISNDIYVRTEFGHSIARLEEVIA